MQKRSGHFFNRYFTIGARPGLNEWETRKLWLINAFYHVGNLTLLATMIETYCFESVAVGHVLLGLTCIFEIGFAALILKKQLFAEWWFMIVGNIIIFTMNNVYGKEGGAYLFYFPFMLVIAYLVDLRKSYYALFHFGITIAFVFAGLMLEHRLFYTQLGGETIATSYNFNFLTAAFSMSLIAFIIVRMGYLQHDTFLERMQERLKAEESMKSVISEKETLLAEVHHRVKNNLAVISSLLNLQLNSVKDEYTREVLRESRNRVASMALIHRKLYQHQNVEEIDFGNYSKSLAEEIANSYTGSVTGHIKVNVNAEHVILPLTKGVPCGLMLNEILSNCYKHAFPNGRNGNITITFRRSSVNKGIMHLDIKDDGIGLPDQLNIDKATSLGLTIISSLAEQLDGEWSLKRGENGGTHFHIAFKVS